MELHRVRVLWVVVGAGAVVLAVVCLVGVGWPILIRLLAAALLLAGAAAAIRFAFTPFRFRIDADGITLHNAGLAGRLPWTEVESVIVDQAPPAVGRSTPILLSLVPAAGSRLADRPAPIVLLDLADVREPVAAVQAALRDFAGDKLDDRLAALCTELTSLSFDTVPGGYDAAQVDAVVAKAAEVMQARHPAARVVARAVLEGNSWRRTEHGYDPAQVDAAFEALAPRLAERH